MISAIIARGIGFGGVNFIPTHGFTPGTGVLLTISVSDSLNNWLDSFTKFKNVLVEGLFTFEDILERIRQTIDNPVYWPDGDIADATQDGYDEIIAVTGSLLKAVVIPFERKLIYYDMKEEIDDFVAVTAIYNTVTKQWLQPVSLRWLDSNREDWEIADGRSPEFFSVVSHRYVAIHPRVSVSDYGNMYVFYKASANALTSDSQIRFNNDFITALEEYAVCDLLEQNQEFTKASKRFKAYLELVQQLETWVKNLRESDRIPGLK